MEIKQIPLDSLRPAKWSPNLMAPERLAKLRRSVAEFGLVENLVVRPNGDGYEVLSGNQRLKVYRELGLTSSPCVIVDLTDPQARLLAQVLNRTRGEDDLGLKAALVRQLAQSIDLEELARYLPEEKSELAGLLSVGEVSVEDAFARWAEREANPLHSLTFALHPEQLDVVTTALERASSLAKDLDRSAGSRRTAALVEMCQAYLNMPWQEEQASATTE
ncbi:MAG: ParB/RepB/Spo0J family partition protein [Chloroflexota bacterium]